MITVLITFACFFFDWLVNIQTLQQMCDSNLILITTIAQLVLTTRVIRIYKFCPLLLVWYLVRVCWLFVLACCLVFGLLVSWLFVADTELSKVANYLLNDITTVHSNHLTVGIIGAKYLLPALQSIGRSGMPLSFTIMTTLLATSAQSRDQPPPVPRHVETYASFWYSVHWILGCCAPHCPWGGEWLVTHRSSDSPQRVASH